MIKTQKLDTGGSSAFLITTACLLLLLSFGYRSGFGLFVKPITEANGWGREIISMALAVQNLFWGIIAVFAGGLADRFGNVKVLIAGTLIYALGMVLTSGVDSPWMLNASTGILVGAGIGGTSFGIVLPAMARPAFPRFKNPTFCQSSYFSGYRFLSRYLCLPSRTSSPCWLCTVDFRVTTPVVRWGLRWVIVNIG